MEGTSFHLVLVLLINFLLGTLIEEDWENFDPL